MTLQLPPTDEQIARMRREVLTTIAVRRTRRRRRFWWVAGATALVLAASTAGVAALFASVDDRNVTACVLSDRRIAVLPNAAGKDDASFCVALGLTAPGR